MDSDELRLIGKVIDYVSSGASFWTISFIDGSSLSLEAVEGDPSSPYGDCYPEIISFFKEKGNT